MGSGLSQTNDEIVENIKVSLDKEFEEKIKNMPSCHPKYIGYRLYLLKNELEEKKKIVELYNKGKRPDGSSIEAHKQ
jgi:hypothetical protein